VPFAAVRSKKELKTFKFSLCLVIFEQGFFRNWGTSTEFLMTSMKGSMANAPASSQVDVYLVEVLNILFALFIFHQRSLRFYR